MENSYQWYVLTGGPCAGKTTTISELERRGYPVSLEGARVFIEEGMAAGLTLDEIRTDPEWFENVVRKQYAIEQALPKDKPAFLDRALPDSIAYYRLTGKAVDGILAEVLAKAHYRKVFLLDLVEFKNDEARNETPEQAMLIHGELREAYLGQGFEVVDVPVMSVAERADFILANL
jgi:predicted ATPase